MEELHVHYNGWVVALSVAIAALASYSALKLASKISRSNVPSRLVWLLTGSCVMGLGVWSMHFVGMLAAPMEMVIEYDPTITIVSVFFSIGAAFIAFFLTAEKEATFWRFAVGGFIMGSGIVAMHYTGMSAMHSSVVVSYDPYLWVLSALIALGASYAALYLFRKFRIAPDFSRWKLLSAVLMGLAISGMHYTGMAAATFQVESDHGLHGMDNEPAYLLLIGVSVATVCILLISIAALFFDRHVLERMAYKDQLTGLSNRHELHRFFSENFNPDMYGSVILIDLDRFKAINDTLGHDIGDILLQQLGERLERILDQQSKVFRLGGDEFLIACLGYDRVQTEQLAGRLVDEIKSPFQIETNTLYVTGSLGISLAPEQGSELSVLMKAADTAMYHAKALGKNRYALYDQQMAQRQLRRLELEKDLSRALAEQEFEIYYQPKWNTSLNALVGMEALIRWNHPSLGMISPDEFIPIAEETGLIIPMTDWILAEVCQQNKKWQELEELFVPVSINLSVRVFECRTLGEKIAEALELSKLDPRYLELEITESIALYDKEDIIDQLQKIRGSGVRIAMDDFGTGYSSLGSLDELPLDMLKIDQEFIHRSNMPGKKALISTMISIANSLNMEVIAEGVETKEQIDFLRSKGCEVMQGFYYAKPMPALQLIEWYMLAKVGQEKNSQVN